MRTLLTRVVVILLIVASVGMVGYSLNGLLRDKPASISDDSVVSQFDDSTVESNKVVEGVVPMGERVTDRGHVVDEGVEELLSCDSLPRSSVFVPAHGMFTTVTNEGELGTFGSDGGLVLPDSVDVATRWAGGADIADPAGVTLIAAHRSYDGYYGVFKKLAEVQEGDIACASDADGVIQKYQVVSLELYLKDALPQDIFENPRIGARELILVTCGGSIYKTENGGLAYDKNVIARFRAID